MRDQARQVNPSVLHTGEEQLVKVLAAGSISESAIMPLDETLAIMQTMDDIRRQLNLKYPMEE